MASPLREVMARFGFQVDSRPLDQVDRRVTSTTASLRSFGAAIAATGITAGLHRFVSGAVEAGDELDKASRRIGISVRDLQALRHAATLSGVGAEQLGTSLQYLARNASEAATRGGRAAEDFTSLGIAVTDASGQVRPALDLFADVAEEISGLTSHSERVGVAMRVFGRSGVQMLPMLEGGRAGVEAMGAELLALGGGAGEDFVSMSVEMTNQLTRFRLAQTSARTTLVASVLPALTRGVTAMTRITTAISRSEAATASATPIMVGLGAAAATAGALALVAWGGALLPITAVAAAAAGLYLVLDDLYVGLQGGDSLIVTLIDRLGKWAGVGPAATQAVQGLNMAWQAIVGALSDGFGPLQTAIIFLSQLAGGADVTKTSVDRLAASIRTIVAVATEAAAAISPLSGVLDLYRAGRSAFQGGADIATLAQQIGVDRQISAPARAAAQHAWVQTPAGNPMLWPRPQPDGESGRSTSGQAGPQGGQPAVPTGIPAFRWPWQAPEPARSPAETPRMIAGQTPGFGGQAAPRRGVEQNVTLHDQRVITFEATTDDPEGTRRIVRQELERDRQAQDRALLATLEPAAEAT